MLTANPTPRRAKDVPSAGPDYNAMPLTRLGTHPAANM